MVAAHCRVPIVVALLAGSAIAQVTFSNVTTQAGVDALQWDGIIDPNTYPLILEMHQMTAGAAAGDFNNDGWPDLFVTRINAPNLLYQNKGDGTFSEVGALAGVDGVGRYSGVVWADIDNNGWLDIIVLSFDPTSSNHVYINQADNTFIDQAHALDLDGFEPGFPAGFFASPAVGDFDKDGDLDVIITGLNQRTKLYRNDAGIFTNQTATVLDFFISVTFGWSARFADIDGDTWPDIMLANDFATSEIYRNLGDGTMVRETTNPVLCTDENGMGHACGDYDLDGDLDWFVTSIYDPNDVCATVGCNWGTSGNRLYQHDGGWNFTDATDFAGVRDGQWGWGASFLDYDNDGDLDLTMAPGVHFQQVTYEDSFNNDPIRLWDNDGSGAMTEVAGVRNYVNPAPGAGKGIVVFDYDRDGDQDVFVANNAAVPVLLRNDGGNRNHWLEVDLVGAATNRFGIGARITAQSTPESPVMMREVDGGSNYMSANESTVHFGLGANGDRIHRVTVYWPGSDATHTYDNLAVDQLVKLWEVACPGDVDGDRMVNLSDLATLLTNFGGSQSSLFDGDLDGDGSVNLTDLGTLLARFGQGC